MSYFDDDFTVDDFTAIIDDANKIQTPRFVSILPTYVENKNLSNNYFSVQNKRVKSKDDEIKLLREEIKEIKQELDKREEILLDMIYTINFRLKVIESSQK